MISQYKSINFLKYTFKNSVIS